MTYDATSPPASPATTFATKWELRPAGDVRGIWSPPAAGRRKSHTPGDEQFGVQDRRACRAPDHVVAERDELVAEHRAGAHATAVDGHAAAGPSARAPPR